MTPIMMSFTDSELLYYGISHSFPEDPSDSLLTRITATECPDALVRLTEIHPGIIPLADSVVSAAMAPRRVLRVFSGSAEGFLRLRLAQHITEDLDASYGTLIANGPASNLLQLLSPQDVMDILGELCQPSAEIAALQPEVPQAFPIGVLEQLALLGACSVVHQNHYEGGWFTAASVSNAFDRSEIRDFSELCAPLAEVADSLIYSATDLESFVHTLESMMNAGMLIKRMVDNVPLYRFAEHLQTLPSQLLSATERFALSSTNQGGQYHLLYSLTGESGQWCFYANSTDGCLIKTGHEGLKILLEKIIMPCPLLIDGHPGHPPVSTPKYCNACGYALSPNSKFCGACGSAVK